jgi:hypothetical protein
MSLSGRNTEELEAVGWQFGFKLTTKHIWDSFICLSLLEDHMERHVQFEVPHKGKQCDRFTEAMHEWNERIVRLGQPEINDFCDMCTRFFKSTGPDGEIIWGLLFWYIFLLLC